MLRSEASTTRPLLVRSAGPALVKTNSSEQPAPRIARHDRLVMEHLPLVRAIAVRVHENLPVHVDLDDLVHAGILGLFDAANKFNPKKQGVFSSYAKHRVKAAMLDGFRQFHSASQDMRLAAQARASRRALADIRKL